jgi:hypothetical protein
MPASRATWITSSTDAISPMLASVSSRMWLV